MNLTLSTETNAPDLSSIATQNEAVSALDEAIGAALNSDPRGLSRTEYEQAASAVVAFQDALYACLLLDQAMQTEVADRAEAIALIRSLGDVHQAALEVIKRVWPEGY